MDAAESPPIETPLGEKWLITPASVDKHATSIEEVGAATDHDDRGHRSRRGRASAALEHAPPTFSMLVRAQCWCARRPSTGPPEE